MVLTSLTLRQGVNISCPELPYVEETDYLFKVLKVSLTCPCGKGSIKVEECME